MVEVAGTEPANSHAHINSTYTIEAKRKQIDKKEFKNMGTNRNKRLEIIRLKQDRSV
jgi:hypothetical protein